MPRATRIVATLGPASNSPEMLGRMLVAGIDVVRLNFSHGRAEDHVALGIPFVRQRLAMRFGRRAPPGA